MIMKKIILTTLVAVASLSASAQFYVGGAIGFQTSKSGEKDAKAQNVFTLSPEIGYDINEKWTVGADLNFQFANQKKGENLGFEVYGRYNYLKTGIATLFVELGVGYSSNKFEFDGDEIKANVNEKAIDNAIANTDAAVDAAMAAAEAGDVDAAMAAAENLAKEAENLAKDAEKPSSEKTFSIAFRPGIKIALSEKVSLVAKTGLIGYQKTKDGPSKFNIGVNNDAIKLGVYYSF